MVFVLNENIKELWGAWVKFPQVEGDIEFNYSPMEVAKQYPLALEMRYPYFISRNNSTQYFDEGMLDKEYEITNELMVFYSASKEKCAEWLESRRDMLLQSYKFDYERLEKSKIKEVEERV